VVLLTCFGIARADNENRQQMFLITCGSITIACECWMNIRVPITLDGADPRGVQSKKKSGWKPSRIESRKRAEV
jgi:hypothetical protein